MGGGERLMDIFMPASNEVLKFRSLGYNLVQTRPLSYNALLNCIRKYIKKNSLHGEEGGGGL